MACSGGLVAVAPEVATQLRIKWPNDLLLEDRKVAGILCEQFRSSGVDATGGDLLVIGVGINVDFDLALLPSDLRHPPTTLSAAASRPVAVDETIDAVAQSIVDVMSQDQREGLGESLLDELRVRLAYVGTTCRVDTPRGSVTGRVFGVDEFGRLILESAEGFIACETGEISTYAGTAIATVRGRRHTLHCRG